MYFSKLVSRIKFLAGGVRKDDEPIKYGIFGKKTCPEAEIPTSARKPASSHCYISWWIKNIYESRYGYCMATRFLLMLFTENQKIFLK